MNKCRVIHKQDGSVAVVHPIARSRRPEETDSKFLKRVFDKAVKGTDLEGLDHEDIDPADLPDRKDRDKWRSGPGKKGIKVDHTLKTENEKRNDLEKLIDDELEKPDGDVNTAAVLRWRRKLETRNYS